MSKSMKKISIKAGLPPGSLIHVGSKKTDKVRISVIDYNKIDIQETACETIEECYPYKDSANVSWINIDGLGDEELLRSVRDLLGIHRLALEDAVNVHQREVGIVQAAAPPQPARVVAQHLGILPDGQQHHVLSGPHGVAVDGLAEWSGPAELRAARRPHADAEP